MTAEEQPSHLLRPQPHRPFSLTPTTTNSTPSTPPTPSDPASSETFVSRTRSVLNLTSSTLFGIYAPADNDSNRIEASTPWGTGSQTPIPRSSIDCDAKPPSNGSYEGSRPRLKRVASSRQYSGYSHGSTTGVVVRTILRTVLLFCFGVAYGVIISHLHDSEQVAPVQVQGYERWSWGYLVGWGSAGVLLGGLLPWVDVLWEDVLGNDIDFFPSNDTEEESTGKEEDERPPGSERSGLGADWNPVVRSIGAFVGIAFAIRKLPWQSTLQVSLTLALVNPVLWYLVDRSKPGFLLSLIVGLAGTVVAFGINPELVPAPAMPSPRAGMGANSSNEGNWMVQDGLISNETIGVGTWIASVLFCSSVCFGNIGRRLALGTGGRGRSVP